MCANAWGAASERLTGITQEILHRDGVSPREAITRFLEIFGDRDIYSDEPDFDEHWLGMLADAAGLSLGGRKINDVRPLTRNLQSTADDNGTTRHQAEADARRLAIAVAENHDTSSQPAP